jgi:hypothetical protein
MKIFKLLFVMLVLFVSTTSANYITPEGYARYIVKSACTSKLDKIACAALKGDKKALEAMCFAGRLHACLYVLGVYDVN